MLWGGTFSVDACRVQTIGEMSEKLGWTVEKLGWTVEKLVFGVLLFQIYQNLTFSV
jgi:hypothetical protein